MGSALNLSETYHFRIADRQLTLHKRRGESYEHVLMKALGFALFRLDFPQLEIERGLGFRYVPDLIAIDDHGRLEFWGECGQVSLRKILWLAKHSGTKRLALFKMGIAANHFINQVKAEIEPRYRPASRISLFNFDRAIVDRVGQEFDQIPSAWYEQYDI